MPPDNPGKDLSLPVPAGAGAARRIVVRANQLPSAQGWTYLAAGNAEPEVAVFSTDGQVLRQNSIACGFPPHNGSGMNGYCYYNVVDRTQPFFLGVRARLLTERVAPSGSLHFGFAFGLYTDTETVVIGLGDKVIQDNGLHVLSTSIDTRLFHDYRIEGDFESHGYRLYVDGVLLHQGQMLAYHDRNYLFLGDATGGTNAMAEISQFTFYQGPVW